MGIRPQARNNGGKQRLSSAQIGTCTECKRGIFAGQEWKQVRRPATGKNHTECVPDDAVIVEAVQP